MKCLCAGRVRLLLGKGQSCYRPRRDGERKRKSVRGCIVDSNLSVLALVIVKKGEQVCDDNIRVQLIQLWNLSEQQKEKCLFTSFIKSQPCVHIQTVSQPKQSHVSGYQFKEDKNNLFLNLFFFTGSVYKSLRIPIFNSLPMEKSKKKNSSS